MTHFLRAVRQRTLTRDSPQGPTAGVNRQWQAASGYLRSFGNSSKVSINGKPPGSLQAVAQNGSFQQSIHTSHFVVGRSKLHRASGAEIQRNPQENVGW